MLALNKPQTMQLIKCLASNNTFELITFESGLTLTSAMEGVSLKKLSSTIEKANVLKAITYLAMRLADNFNVGKNLTDDQAALLAMDMFELLPYETLEDVVLIFKYARQGRIGDGKDFKLDSQNVLTKWVPQYLELKAVERENQHNKFKGDNNIRNFKWDAEDVAKFKTSDEKQTITTKPTGLGERSKKHFATDAEPTSPIVNRQRYLAGLAYEATKAPIQNLKTVLEYFKSKDEKDAIEVIEKEINSRESTNP